MPTLNWIQETAIDRFCETGAGSAIMLEPITYKCRQCSRIFDARALRDMHELEHPVKNPVLIILGREILEHRLRITRRLEPKDVEFGFVEHLQINGVSSASIAAVIEALCDADDESFELLYSNEFIQKKVNIEICIANQDELDLVDSCFLRRFARDDFDSYDIAQFLAEIKTCKTTKNYEHGLVRYLHGVMAKDQRASSVRFEEFNKLFNEAMQYLGEYQTSLSSAIRYLIRFNFNDFRLQGNTDMPALDQAFSFFQGGVSRSNIRPDRPEKLPIDCSTSFIVNEVLATYEKWSLNDIEIYIASLNKRNVTLEDRNKLHYIAYRKSWDTGNIAKKSFYSRDLKVDDIFCNLLDGLN